MKFSEKWPEYQYSAPNLAQGTNIITPPPRPGIFEEYIPPGVPTSFVGTALFPQGLWEQEIGSLLTQSGDTRAYSI